jgi:hypothetical protein
LLAAVEIIPIINTIIKNEVFLIIDEDNIFEFLKRVENDSNEE